METSAHMQHTVDSWIVEDELPASPVLKVIRTTHPDYGLSDDEIAERNEYISWYLSQDYELIMMIRKQEPEEDYFFSDCPVTAEEYSAFNTHDFQKTLPAFNRYGYAMKKILERVKDLAILHSCLSSPEGRGSVCRRYESLLEHEFRDRLMRCVKRYRYTVDEDERFELKKRIGELNRRIFDCKRIWEQNAPGDP